MKTKIAILAAFLLLSSGNASAQDTLPRDNTNPPYFPAPHYRESESHPLRSAAYLLHPIGWSLREFVYRPISAAIASNPVSKSVFGYRDPYDFRETLCFNPNADIPDCAMVPPYSKISHSTTVGGATGNGFGKSGDGGFNDGYGNSGSGLNEAALNQLNSTKQIYFPDVAFEFGKSKLNALGEGRVRQIALLLQADPELNVLLEGNADARGSDEYNKKLGERRAQTVKNELVALGISPERLETKSMGKTAPVFTENTEWAHAVNRRVMVTVGYGKDVYDIKTPEQQAQVQEPATTNDVAPMEAAVNEGADLPPPALLE